MKQIYFIFFLSFFSISLMGQKSIIKGIVTDATNKEPLIGATISIGGSGTVTDFDGNYSLELENGNYTLNVSYVGYESKDFNLEMKGDQTFDISLDSDLVLKEVVVSADIAIERETPIAFSNITPKKLQEELGAQDIPMILNSTPGAYATETGGGDGDARISIRGFNQRNIAVMLDGIPVNDMENGRVFWSNWFGLDLVTQTIQVQRGLGASKISVPSVGGTINILTKGIESKKGIKFKQELGNNGFTRSTIGLTSGRLKNGWGVSATASYKQGDGWVDGNFTEGYFYYLRIDKELGNHRLSLQGFGAPQEHGQRPFTTEIAFVDTQKALDLGVPQSTIEMMQEIDRNNGRRFNEHWGFQNGQLKTTRKNFFHKPQFNLRHSWQANDRLYWSNIAYLSIGRGGGTAPENIPRNEEGRFDFDKAFEVNQRVSVFNPDTLSSSIIRSSNNEHFWYGFLSTLQYQISNQLTFSGGLDGRSYRGDHFRTVYDVLGGQGFNNEGNSLVDPTIPVREGDKYVYDYSSFVNWGGAFALLEYKSGPWSVFANLSGALSTYSYEDFFKPKRVELQDTSFLVSFVNPVEFDGVNYTIDSPEAELQTIDDVNLQSLTFKTGASYKLNQNNSVFVNTGYISKAQRFNLSLIHI